MDAAAGAGGREAVSAPVPGMPPAVRFALRALNRRTLRALNRYVWAPALKLGLGPFAVSPIGGYILLLRTTGRKSGRRREAPLDYALDRGRVYCLAGFGRRTDWFQNLLADPHVEVILPGGAIAGLAEEVADADERARVLPHLVRNAGLPGFLVGCNPFTAPDAELLARTDGLPLVRITPTGIGAGPADPGGWLWLVWAVLPAWLAWRALRRRGAGCDAQPSQRRGQSLR